MAEIVVNAQTRDDRGKNAARRLRAKGLIPAVVYGGTADVRSVTVDPKVLLKVIRSESGRNTILNLDFGDGTKSSAILKSWQVDPVDERFIHADFYRIKMDVAIKVKVQIVGSRSSKEFEFNTTMGPKGDMLDGWAIYLEDLSPVPRADKKPNPKQYTAKFKVTRLTR